MNTLARIVPEEQHEKIEQFGPRLKRGRPVRSNDVVPKKKGLN